MTHFPYTGRTGSDGSPTLVLVDDEVYSDLIEALDFLLELISDDFAIIEWHARVFLTDARFERALRAGLHA
ncbi:hypothetical protein [Burkholderia ubonensis]|uniref:hypothetical protein n=1 Tax=Burkholderia ubonensis TaxID=101571 RepID=UPI000756EF8B|nr:hypothetical protein [Burkholderia ubonensis]KVS41116.1 hypothetical protein WK38_31665 [Burkholderia ubonensis]KVS45868.1 hypothetical protein WK37_12790 [Burkholderia ubonensis]KVS79742.1 hypothetical protein WK42_14495 [Burkholderia ubonensis]KVS87407.1 hypothetical protein WK44_00150 [Burkholderia ubonensis]KVS94654.1 hypothetical protein WK43_09370 [Burkholderia ubonensis]